MLRISGVALRFIADAGNFVTLKGMSETIINRVALSALEQIDLEEFLPKEKIMGFDLKAFLFMEMIIKEKDFRESLEQHDWAQYQHKIVAVHCSADAIIPQWAYMLVASYLQPFSSAIYFGDESSVSEKVLLHNIQAIDSAQYIDKRVIVKGCGEHQVGPAAYLAIAEKLRPAAKSIMYGEACSTVPVYKKK